MPTRILHLILLGLLSAALAGGLARPARAQTPAAPSPALADSLAAIAREDTAIALQRLFFDQRRSGLGKVLVYSLMGGLSGYLLFDKSPETTYQRVASGGIGVLAVACTYGVIEQVVQVRRFRPGREQQVLESLENGRPLPPWVRRRLTPGYFSARVTAY